MARLLEITIVATVDLLLLECLHKALRLSIVVRIADPAHARLNVVGRKHSRVVATSVLGGFKWSSQHLDGGGCDEPSKATFGSVWTDAIVFPRSTAGGRTR